jgi:two-component system, chemotaxis family, protein-glutamate methylesterase/glutaminase
VEAAAQVPHDPPLVVIGASAGGVEALVKIVGGLDDTLGAPVVIVLHLPATGTSVLPDILRRSGRLPVSVAVDGHPLVPNAILVAPPDHHVLVRDGFVVLDRGPRENGSRPAIDPLFRTAAGARGGGVIGVVLSGALDDGAAGLRAIKEAGGVAVVQDPNDALTPSMPAAALAAVAVDHVVPAHGVPDLLTRLVEERMRVPVPERVAMTGNPHPVKPPDGVEKMPGPPSPFTCPECGGVVWEEREGDLVRYRCHVGHSYLAESMLEQQSSAIESALWTALRILEERAAFLAHLADRQRERGNDFSARGFERRAADVQERARVLREAVARGETVDGDAAVSAS